MTSVVRYNKSDFEKIQSDGFTYILTPETMKIIQAIATQVGSPEYIKTPQFEKREITKNGINNNSNNNKFKRGKAQEVSDDDWRNVPAAVIAKKEGFDAAIDQIRKHLNKMTNKTYDSLKEKIVEEIEQISKHYKNVNAGQAHAHAQSDEKLEVELNKIGEALFTIASGNSFFSSMYAQLFKELMDTFNFMRIIFDANFEKFYSIFNTIEYCDPNENYDKFCENNKLNEQRRAISLFYVNLMIQNVISPNKLIVIIRNLQNYMNALLSKANNKNIVDELSEILYILITNSYDNIKDEPEWEEIVTFIKTISVMKPTTMPSISNKTVFKHMDMLDVI